jgi:integrase
LTIEEFKSILDNAAPHIRRIVGMGFYSGMRRGEILGLTWDKVNLEKRVIELEAQDTKDREPRTMPISQELFQILKSVPMALHDNHVFLYKGKPVQSIKTGLIRACRDARSGYGRFAKGGFIFHDLRHCFNTNMRRAGVAESVIMSITGHSTRTMFARYNTIDVEDAQNAVDQLGLYLGNLDQSLDQEGSRE